MTGNAATGPAPGGLPLPPTTTQWPHEQERPQAEAGSILPPFFAGGTGARYEVAPATAGGPAVPPPMRDEEDPATGDVVADLPADALYSLPEGAPPVGSGPAPADALPGLADRLERLARELRQRGASALEPRAGGDRLDELLAALLAGYLAGHDG